MRCAKRVGLDHRQASLSVNQENPFGDAGQLSGYRFQRGNILNHGQIRRDDNRSKITALDGCTVEQFRRYYVFVLEH